MPYLAQHGCVHLYILDMGEKRWKPQTVKQYASNFLEFVILNFLTRPFSLGCFNPTYINLAQAHHLLLTCPTAVLFVYSYQLLLVSLKQGNLQWYGDYLHGLKQTRFGPYKEQLQSDAFKTKYWQYNNMK